MSFGRAPFGRAPFARALTALALSYAVPISDISAGGWTPSAGADLFAMIDETPDAVDTDFDISAVDPSSDTFEVKLSAIGDPAVSTDHVVRYRYGKPLTDDRIDLVVSLRQGASTEIAAWTHADIPQGWTTAAQTLSGGQADAITDYSDLRLRFVATKV